MSGLPYLQKLRKSDLTEFAETSKLPEYVLPQPPLQRVYSGVALLGA